MGSMDAFKNNKPSPLRIARQVAGLRQTDLATAINRSQMFVSRLERGRSAILTPEIADRLADTLGSPAVLLFNGGGNGRER